MKYALLLGCLLFSFAAESQKISEIRSVVAFIYVKDSLGMPIPNGTCFFIAIKSRKDSQASFPTAKHVCKKRMEAVFTVRFLFE
jgi:hypothetical protein